MDDLPKMSRTASFHQRRLNEMRQYDESLNVLVFRKKGKPDKLDLSQQRILRQASAYEVLTHIWAASPYAVGVGTWENWDCYQTAYRLASELAELPKRAAHLNYINRVVDAASSFGLIERDTAAPNRILLRGTPLLHKFMERFASACENGDPA